MNVIIFTIHSHSLSPRVSCIDGYLHRYLLNSIWHKRRSYKHSLPVGLCTAGILTDSSRLPHAQGSHFSAVQEMLAVSWEDSIHQLPGSQDLHPRRLWQSHGQLDCMGMGALPRGCWLWDTRVLPACDLVMNTTAGRGWIRSMMEISLALGEACVCADNEVIGTGWLCVYLHSE